MTDTTTHPQDLNLSSPPGRALSTSAGFGALGGLALFADLSLHAFGPLGRSYFIIATAMALCLLGVPTAYWLRNAITGGWRRVLAGTGTGLVAIGASAWILAFVILLNDPGAAYTQRLTPAGSVLMALGMLLIGISVVASRRLAGLRRLAPLAVGIYFPAQLILQFGFFLNGKDASPGPNGALLGAWGLVWIWAAWSSVTARSRTRVDRAHRRQDSRNQIDSSV